MSVAIVLMGVFWLGVLTAVSPCPMATNIAAISFLSHHVASPRRVLWSAFLYTLGRTIVYVGLGVALLATFQWLAGGQGNLKEFASPASRMIQHYGNMAIGPILVVIGMILLDLIEIHASLSINGARMQDRIERNGAIWALPLGMLFAMAFCPPSVALFLSALMISLNHESMILPPMVYGIGTAIPVIAFALLIAFAGRYVGEAFNMMNRVERRFRLLTGAIFIVVGIRYILKHIYGVDWA